jgi:DNA-directed RNA polymerase subunit RPC12/RpoP
LAPRYVCAICGTAAPVDAKFRCSPCAAEIALGVKHAQSGLRVVP